MMICFCEGFSLKPSLWDHDASGRTTASRRPSLACVASCQTWLRTPRASKFGTGVPWDICNWLCCQYLKISKMDPSRSNFDLFLPTFLKNGGDFFGWSKFLAVWYGISISCLLATIPWIFNILAKLNFWWIFKIYFFWWIFGEFLLGGPNA